MTPLQLAQKYMDILFGDGDVRKLGELFTDDFTFEGPLYTFNSPEDYIQSLLSDPPKNFEYKIIKSFEDGSSACLLYQFSKNNITLPMAQLFEVENDKIKKIILVFDATQFK